MGGVMQICITLDIFFNTAKAQICTYSKLFDFYYIHIWHIFAKFHASRWLRSKFMAILGWSVARRIKFFLSKSLKTEYAIKSRDLLCFYSNFNTTLILIVEICWNSQILKIFKFGPPTKKDFKFSPISPIFGQKFPNRDLLIYFHTWNFLAFKIYICGTFWQNFMVVGSCVQYLWPFWDRILTENPSFLVKTLKNWICPKITSLASFSIKFSHNTYITNTNMKK